MVSKAKIVEINRSDQTVDVSVEYIDEKGKIVTKRSFNFHTNSDQSKGDLRKTITDDIKKVGKEYKDVISKSDDLQDLKDTEIAI